MRLITAALAIGTASVLQARVVFNTSYTGIDASVPDGDPSGLVNSQTVTGASGIISDVNITLTIGGTGFGAVNGDFYAYLAHGDQIAILLNRPGRRSDDAMGYDDNGLDTVTFDDSGSNGDVHTYRFQLFGDHSIAITPGLTPLTGTWAPDGRDVDPGSVLDGDSRTRTLGVFNGLDANGPWTLFLADMETGGTARLESWSLQITTTPVPEPHETALVLGLGLGVFAFWRRRGRA